MSSRRHYLDHASLTRLRPEAAAAMGEWLAAARDGMVGDPGRVHQEAMVARQVVEDARAQVAALAGARPREVVFTSGATEARISAVAGAAGRGSHQVVTAVEHSSIRETAARVATEVTVVPCDGLGRVDPERVLAAVRDDTGLVSVQWGNHEVGTRQPVADLVGPCRDRGVLLHVDAEQALGHEPLRFDDDGPDLLSAGGHTVGGPTGIGVLLIRQGLRIDPLLVGSSQERARRAGLENTVGIVGLGAAAEAARAGMVEESTRTRRLTDRVLDLARELDGLRIHGDPEDRLPHLVCLGVDDVEPQAVVLGLDQAGVAVHSGSSCSTEELEPSPVLEAMGVDAAHSLRVSLGWSSTDHDVDALTDALPRVLERFRSYRA